MKPFSAPPMIGLPSTGGGVTSYLSHSEARELAMSILALVEPQKPVKGKETGNAGQWAEAAAKAIYQHACHMGMATEYDGIIAGWAEMISKRARHFLADGGVRFNESGHESDINYLLKSCEFLLDYYVKDATDDTDQIRLDIDNIRRGMAQDLEARNGRIANQANQAVAQEELRRKCEECKDLEARIDNQQAEIGRLERDSDRQHRTALEYLKTIDRLTKELDALVKAVGPITELTPKDDGIRYRAADGLIYNNGSCVLSQPRHQAIVDAYSARKIG